MSAMAVHKLLIKAITKGNIKIAWPNTYYSSSPIPSVFTGRGMLSSTSTLHWKWEQNSRTFKHSYKSKLGWTSSRRILDPCTQFEDKYIVKNAILKHSIHEVHPPLAQILHCRKMS